MDLPTSPIPAARLANPFSPTSWQHVIGHKKLQLCINLWLRSLGAGNGRWAKGNRNETNRMKWPLWDGGSGQRKGWKGTGRAMASTRTTSLLNAYHYMPSNFNAENPFGPEHSTRSNGKGWQTGAGHLISVVSDANIIICMTSESRNM